MVAFDRNRRGGKRLRAFGRVGWLFDEGWLRGAFASTISMNSDFNAATVLRIGYWESVCWYCAVALDALPLINRLMALGVVRHVDWVGAWKLDQGMEEVSTKNINQSCIITTAGGDECRSK
jgi:hypothetical protein